MTIEAIIDELRAMGSESIKKVLVKHGAREPFFGVRIGDMKPLVKRIRKEAPNCHQVALGLYDTGISDAMYLDGCGKPAWLGTRVAMDWKSTGADRPPPPWVP